MIDGDFAIQFATEWIDSWNKHNLEGVLSHYMCEPKLEAYLAGERCHPVLRHACL